MVLRHSLPQQSCAGEVVKSKKLMSVSTGSGVAFWSQVCGGAPEDPGILGDLCSGDMSRDLRLDYGMRYVESKPKTASKLFKRMSLSTPAKPCARQVSWSPLKHPPAGEVRQLQVFRPGAKKAGGLPS